jgi:hypothetical protein
VRIRASLLVVCLFGFNGIFPGIAWAVSIQIPFEKMIENSPTIVVARFLGEQSDMNRDTIQVDVTQVLKGDLKPGKHQFSLVSLRQIGAKGEEFVAFLDKDRAWRFFASPLKGDNKVDQSVLKILGFSNISVTPNFITLDQLKTYLKDGSLIYRFRGEVYFPEPKKADWKPGSLVVSGTYDLIKKKVNVKGLPNLQGFPSQPEISFPPLYDSNLRLLYAHVWLNRPLNLVGNVRGFDNKTGEMTFRFAVSTPQVLTQKAFEDYLADASKGTCNFKFKLTCAPKNDSTVPKTVFLTTAAWPGKARLEGFGKSPFYVIGTSYASPMGNAEYVNDSSSNLLPKTIADESSKKDGVFRMSLKGEGGECLTLGFQIGEPNRGENAFTWPTMSELIYAVYRNPVKGTITLHDGKTARTVATISTTLDSVEFNRNEKER